MTELTRLENAIKELNNAYVSLRKSKPLEYQDGIDLVLNDFTEDTDDYGAGTSNMMNALHMGKQIKEEILEIFLIRKKDK